MVNNGENYFMGRCPDILPLIRYVQLLLGIPVIDEDMKQAIGHEGMMVDGKGR